jgi:hypothetical protein
MLSSDPMNAVVNGIGHQVLLWPEARNLVEKAATDFGRVTVPGTTKQVVSPAKLISGAYSDWAKYLMGDAAAVARFKRFEQQGWMPSIVDMQRQVLDNATLRGVEKVGEMEGKISNAVNLTRDFMTKWSGNKSVEEMNRFIAATVADNIMAPLVAAGSRTRQEADAFINTFLNRTQGNHLASQRPLMFQGPVGQAIGLFQTYAFTLYQALFRNIADEKKRSAATMMGLQSGIFGMQGLPMFNFMNEYLVGNAAGNRSHQDIHSFTRDAAGDTMGNWLLYGSLSNVTNMGLYSRGDMNPRQLTVVPTDLSQVPFVSAWTRAIGQTIKTAEEMRAGGNVASTFLRGIEHAGLSRPLAGLAVVGQGAVNEEGMAISTTSKNNIVAAHEVWNIASLGRIAGARPLDEAMLRDAYYRVQVYSGGSAKHVAAVGSAIRDRVRNGEDISQEDVQGFLNEYVKGGGNQKDFNKFWLQQVKKAKKSQIEQMVSHVGTPQSQYMQKMLGGLGDINEFTDEGE